MTMPIDAEAARDAGRAMSGVLMAAAFVTEPEVWPGFAAYAERVTGQEFTSTPERMDYAIRIVDAVRRGLAAARGEDPGTPYPPRWSNG